MSLYRTCCNSLNTRHDVFLTFWQSGVRVWRVTSSCQTRTWPQSYKARGNASIRYSTTRSGHTHVYKTYCSLTVVWFTHILLYSQTWFLSSQVPDGATVALVPRNVKHHLHDSHDYMPGESERICHVIFSLCLVLAQTWLSLVLGLDFVFLGQV